MAHILLGLDLIEDGSLGDKLHSWGMTSGPWLHSREGRCWPDAWACDCVLVSPREMAALASVGMTCPATAQAPVLVWDGDLVRGPEPVLQLSMPPVPARGDLYATLQICLAHAVYLRGLAQAVPILEDNPLRVIGHELLTPLAAIKAALEIMAEDPGDPDSQLKMTTLALRNVDRLSEAVAWNQNLLAESQPSKLLSPVEDQNHRVEGLPLRDSVTVT